MRYLTIHCKPSMLETIKKLDLDWFYSPQFNLDEIDVNIPYSIEVEDLNNNTDEDSEFCKHFGLDYDQVNCIELF